MNEISVHVRLRARKSQTSGDEFELRVQNVDYLILSYDVRKLITKLQRAKNGESVKLINTKITANIIQYKKIAEYFELVLASWMKEG